MTTLNPRTPYTDEELKTLYPAGLQLKSVQVLLRHGERTPVSPRFQNAGLPASWPYCQGIRRLRSIILSADGSWDHLQWQRRLETFGPNDQPELLKGSKAEIDGICNAGELTDRGRETTLALGQRLRSLYVDKLKFLPAKLEAGEEAYVSLRATPIPRALESVQQTFTGLYPPATRGEGFQPPTVVQRQIQNETLFPNEGACKRFAELFAAFGERAAQRWNSSDELKYITKKIGKWMPKESPVAKVDSHPRLSGIMDTVNSTLAHGPNTRLPQEFYDKKLREHMDRAVTEEWFAGYEESNEFRKLGIGAVIGDLTQRMVESVRNVPREGQSAPAKISLSGCHDTTLAAALTALGGFSTKRDHWPFYTSSIAFELLQAKDHVTDVKQRSSWWSSIFSASRQSADDARAPLNSMTERSKQQLSGHYVRIRYNDAPVTLPYCQPVGRHYGDDPTICTLAAFKEAADSMTPRDWKAECKANLGAPVFPTAIERPPGVSA